MTGNLTDGSSVVTGVSPGTSGIAVGQSVTATGVQPGTTVQFINSGTSFTLSQVAVASGTAVTLTLGPVISILEASATAGRFSSLPNLSTSSNTQTVAPPKPRMWTYGGKFTSKVNFTGTVGGITRATAGSFSSIGFLIDPQQGLTVRDVIQEILLLWGIEQPALAFDYILRAAIHDLNSAMQQIWSVAKDVDYFSRQTVTLTFPSGETSVGLSQNVIAALGPARIAATGQPLRVISSRGQYDSFAPIYLGSLGFAVSAGTPLAFWIERLNQAQPDNVKAIMHVVPAPSQDTDVLLDVSIEAPRYQWSDYVEATPIEMFHLYADSVLLPVARYKAMSSQYFLRPERTPTLVADYQDAMRIIGAVDPQAKEVSFSDRASATAKEAA